MTTVLSPEQWQEQAELHRQRAESLTAEHLERRRAGKNIPSLIFCSSTTPLNRRNWPGGTLVPGCCWREILRMPGGGITPLSPTV